MEPFLHQRGLYVHVPFCRRKCHYCNFVITIDRSESMRERFFAALENEIKESRRRYGRLRFDTLYLGGGTPSALSNEEMERLLQLLREHFDFAAGHELTCEMNPEDAELEKVLAFQKLGVNRVSLGAQSFKDALLEDTGRMHRSSDIEATVRRLRENGIQNISLDLILRLPAQSVEDFEDSLLSAIRLEASQVSLYDLEVHEKTAYGLRMNQGRLVLPEENEHARMFAAAENFLTSAGYSQYEISTFAKPGFESQHNLIYWHNREYLGLGPGAFSYLKGVRYQFAEDVKSYLSKCEKGEWSCETEDVLSDEKKEIETLLTGIRLKSGVDLEKFSFIRSRLEEQIPFLLESGVVARAGSRIFLTRRGRSLAENTFLQLI